MTDARYFALIPAAGVGARMDADRPKQYLPVLGVPMLRRSAQVFAASAQIAHTFVVVGADDPYADEALDGLRATLLHCGGATRHQSVLNGLRMMREHVRDHDWVLVHDAARPGLTQDLIAKLIDGVRDDAVGGLLALPVVDTVRREGGAEATTATVARDGLWLAQTPQMFRFKLLWNALSQAPEQVDITDEASAVEAQGLSVRLIEGDPRNLKVTLPRDLATVELYLQKDEAIMNVETTGAPASALPAALPPFRIGQGYDCHVLTAGRLLIIGGVTIDHPKGLLGHSDADVLLHALTDALLGAAGLGDIGRHFPDTDARFKGADSRVLLREAAVRVLATGYRIANVDCTIIAQAPKMAPHIAAMVAHIAADLGIAAGQVNVKAKTNEKLGFLGREEGIAAEAVALLFKA